MPIQEVHDVNPESSYGIQKLAIEKYLYLFYKNYGLDYLILRPSNPYGPRQNPLANQGLISVALNKAKLSEPIQIWGDGSIVRDYIFIDDLINAAISAAFTQTSSKVFNIGSGKGYSINQIIEKVCKITGREISILYGIPRACDPKTVVLDTARAKNELDWNLTVNIDKGISQTWNFIENET